MKTSLSRTLLTLTSFLCVLYSCAEKPISQLPPEEGIMRIRENHSDKVWERVIADVNEYRSRYPYTQYAPEAELLQADAFFQSGRYSEAIVTYEEFLKKNPKHSQAPFAAFRIASSYDKEAPEEIDREQEYAIKAVNRYRSFLERFPESSYAKEATERVTVLRRRIAEHFVFVARFYWKKDLYQGALSRYLQVIENYENFADLRNEAIDRAAECYRKLAKVLEKDPKSDKVVYFRSATPEQLRKKATELEAKKTKSPL